MFKRAPIAHLALLSCLAFSAPLHAEPEAAEQLVTLSGFGTIGAIHNQGNGSSFIRDVTQAKGATNKGVFWEIDSRIGLQATIKPSENLEGVAQVISRYQSENNFYPELTWGFLKYSPNDIIDMRAGRVGFDVYLAADSRDVGFSYLWVRPPTEYYGAVPLHFIDGGDIVFRTPIGSGVSRLKLYSGLVRQQIGSLVNQREWAGNVQADAGSIADLSGSRVIGGLIDYQDNNWTVRLGMTDLRVLHEFPTHQIDVLGLIRGEAQAQTSTNPTLANSLNLFANDIALSSKHITFTNLGVAFDNGPLRTQLGLSHFTSESLLFPETDASYLSVGYRYGKLTPYAVISAVKGKKSSRADELAGQGIDNLVSLTNFLIKDGSGLQIQNTLSLGVRYDLTNNAALKFQVDMIHNKTCSPVSLPLTGTSPPCSPPLLWPTVPVSWDGRATVYSAVLDFTF